METISQNIQNKTYKNNRSLQIDLQNLSPDNMRNLAIKLNIINKDSKKFKSTTLTKKILSYYTK
jgi:hypothetical protein